MYRFRYVACYSKNNKHMPRHENHVKPLLILQCFGEKICPTRPWHLFLKHVFRFSDKKPGVCLLLSLPQSHSESYVNMTFQVDVWSSSGQECQRQDRMEGVTALTGKRKMALWPQCLSLIVGVSGGGSHLCPQSDLRRLERPFFSMRFLPWICMEGQNSHSHIFQSQQ